MFATIRLNDVSNMRSYLKHKTPDLNKIYENGLYPLQYAIFLNRLSMIALFVEFGADIHVKNWEGTSMLYLAVKYRSMKCIQLLLSLGANPNEIVIYKKSPRPLFHVACLSNNIKIVKLFVEAKVTLNSIYDSSVCIPYSIFLLFYWIEERKIPLDILSYLIDCGLIVNFENLDHAVFDTPLFDTLRFGDIETSKFLLERGASMNAVGRFNETLSTIAPMFFRTFESLEFVCNNIADSSTQNNSGKSLLHELYLAHKNKDIIILALQNFQTINVIDAKGKSILYKVDSIETAALLFHAGVNPNIGKSFGFFTHDKVFEAKLELLKRSLSLKNLCIRSLRTKHALNELRALMPCCMLEKSTNGVIYKKY